MIGHSLGGAVAVHLAARHPELVDRLVLVEPALDVPAIGPGPEDMALEPEEELDRGGFERILAREVPWRRAEVRLTAPHALVRSARSLLDEHAAATNDLLEHLRQPVVLVRGGHRTYARQDRFDAVGIRSVRLPDAAHFVMHDAPDALLSALEDAAP
ncbi:alpha/beta fold hydrolase [Brachybacterium sp. J153]|uniref:alpha/beta fold hydrolase n=1 Tax=Brachybacterium sp. J153 TaxID=3116488 RepID=UPI002E7A9370|nr:alpha/beta fold hydrolase [Brachybacterium sp. J153]MEE1617734.1 alpha/beta fold hydrolase [Brachybacterium sp. J153]